MSRFVLALAGLAMLLAASSTAQADEPIRIVVPGVGEARVGDPSDLIPLSATDIGQACHMLVGSGSTNVAAVGIDRCLAAQPPSPCPLTDTLNVIDLVSIRYGTCVDPAQLADQRSLTVGGVVTIRLLP
jgi:hypothetical protein